MAKKFVIIGDPIRQGPWFGPPRILRRTLRRLIDQVEGHNQSLRGMLDILFYEMTGVTVGVAFRAL